MPEPRKLNLAKLTRDLGKRESNRLLADLAVTDRLAKTGQRPVVTAAPDHADMAKRGWLK